MGPNGSGKHAIDTLMGHRTTKSSARGVVQGKTSDAAA